MAGPGTYAAYQQVQPIQEDFGNNVLQAEDQQFKYREEQRRKENDAYLKQQDKDKQYRLDMDQIKPVVTGEKNVDQLNYELFNQAVQRRGEIHRLESQGNLTSEQRTQLEYEKSMLAKSPELLKGFTDHITKYVTTVNEGLANGTISKAEADDMLTLSAAFKGQYEPTFKNGIPTFRVHRDDGRIEEISPMDVYNGNRFNFNDITRTVSGDTIAKGVVDTLGKREQVSRQNGMIVTSQNFESQRQAASAYVDKLLGDPNTPSNEAKSLWYDEMERSGPISPEGYAEIKQHLMTKIEAGYDNTEEAKQWHVSSSGGPTAGQQSQAQKDFTAYVTANRFAQGDASALALVSNLDINHEGKTETVAEAIPVGNKIRLVRTDGTTITEMEKGSEGAVNFAARYLGGTSGNPIETQRSLDAGRQAYYQQTGTYQVPVANEAQTQAPVEVPKMTEKELAVVDKISPSTVLKGAESAKQYAAMLKNHFNGTEKDDKNSGFIFESTKKDKKGLFTGDDHMLQVTAPNGVIFEANIKDPNIKSTLKQFMLDNQVENTIEYQPTAGASGVDWKK